MGKDNKHRIKRPILSLFAILGLLVLSTGLLTVIAVGKESTYMLITILVGVLILTNVALIVLVARDKDQRERRPVESIVNAAEVTQLLAEPITQTVMNRVEGSIHSLIQEHTKAALDAAARKWNSDLQKILRQVSEDFQSESDEPTSSQTRPSTTRIYDPQTKVQRVTPLELYLPDDDAEKRQKLEEALSSYFTTFGIEVRADPTEAAR